MIEAIAAWYRRRYGYPCTIVDANIEVRRGRIRRTDGVLAVRPDNFNTWMRATEDGDVAFPGRTGTWHTRRRVR